MADSHHLENAYDAHSARNGPIWTKFGTQTQNDIPMTTEWSKSKTKVKSNMSAESSFDSAENWRISTKFGTQVASGLYYRVISPN